MDDPIVVRETEILAADPVVLRRQKLARVTLDSMIQFVGLLDAEGTVLEINQVALDGVGIELADIEGKPFWTTFWWQVSEEINATLRASIARAAKGELVRWDTPIYGRAGGTETIIIDASLAPVLDHRGNVVFLCAEGRDITEKKAQEREIAQKNRELQGLLERIRELDEIKTQFFANVSHELRTPLALILGPAQRLIDDDGAMDPAERRESAEVVARNARMLLKHVNDLLDMSRLEARKLKIELQDVDVAALLRFLASHFAVLAADRRIELAVLAADPCVAAVDGEKLQRVLMNLLGNAWCSIPTSAAPASRSRSRSIASPPASTAAADPASLDRTLLDGILAELSPPPREALVRPADVAPASGPAAGRPRILVVEDNADMNRFVSRSLASRYEVLSAFDGAEGLEMALRWRPALVVSDIMMPGMSGVEMIAALRRQPELRLHTAEAVVIRK